jgi:hypothetical protein
VNQTLKTLLKIGAVIAIPGFGAYLLVKKLSEVSSPDVRDFKKYVQHHYNRLKVEESKWLQ